MNYFDTSIKMESKMIKGVKGVFNFITGNDAFENIYTGTHDRWYSKICFSGNVAGDIIPIIINSNESYTFDNDNLLCYSSNIKFETTYRFKNIIGSGDISLTKASIITGDKGIIWLHTYDSYQKLDIKAGETIKIDTGMFIIANSKFQYNISKLGGIKNMLFSSQDLIYMEFKGPGTVYINSRNRRREIKELQTMLNIKK